MNQKQEELLNTIFNQKEHRNFAVLSADHTELEKDLKRLGYNGYVKITGRWNKSPCTELSCKEAVLIIVLNTGNGNFEDFCKDMTYLQEHYQNSDLFLWQHIQHSLYYVNQIMGKRIILDNVVGGNLIKNDCLLLGAYLFSFSEVEAAENFESTFNRNGNTFSALRYSINRKKLRAQHFYDT